MTREGNEVLIMSWLYKNDLNRLKEERCIIFGPIHNEGHFAYSSQSGMFLNSGFGSWIASKDGVFCPQFNDQRVGEALLHQFDGFCILAFWARCFDARLGSNIAFVIHGNHEFQSACDIARSVFGPVWDKFNFEVKDIGHDKTD